MAVKVKSGADASKKFVSRGAAAAGDYAAGVRGSGQTWEENTSAAADTYAAGTQAAIARGGFAKGVRKAGAQKFEAKAAGIGAQRFGPGIQAAGNDYATGVQPYLDTIAGLSLPARRPKGDPSNIQRVAAVADALRARKLAG